MTYRKVLKFCNFCVLDAATSNTEEKFDSLNDALAPAMSLEGMYLIHNWYLLMKT